MRTASGRTLQDAQGEAGSGASSRPASTGCRSSIPVRSRSVAERADARLDRLLGYEEIRQLVARYAVATDARDLDALVALFVDDVQVGRHERGRAALRAFFDRSLRDVGITILNTGTHMIDFVGDAGVERALRIAHRRAHNDAALRQALDDVPPDEARAAENRDTFDRHCRTGNGIARGRTRPWRRP